MENRCLFMITDSYLYFYYQSEEEKTMVNKRFWLGIFVLVFGLMVFGCSLFGDDDYTFEFTVKNTWNGVITQIDFINGDGPNYPILQTEMVRLERGDKSDVYKISGFTKTPDGDKEDRCFAIRITYEDGTKCGDDSSAKNKSKIDVEVSNLFDPPMLVFWGATHP